MSLREDFEKIHRKMERIEDESFAMSLLSDYKRINKRQFIVILVILLLWFLTLVYLAHVLNDIGVIETTTQEVSQENDNGNNNFIGNNGDIINGKTKDKTN